MRKQITVDAILEAYEKTKVEPTQEEWVSFREGSLCACGLAALCAAEGVDLERQMDEMSVRFIYTTLRDKGYDITEPFIQGFVQGFDNDNNRLHYLSEEKKAQYDKGFKIGTETREKLFL